MEAKPFAAYHSSLFLPHLLKAIQGSIRDRIGANLIGLGYKSSPDMASRFEISAMRRRCLATGEEAELIFIGFHLVLIDIWRGELNGAATTAPGTAPSRHENASPSGTAGKSR